MRRYISFFGCFFAGFRHLPRVSQKHHLFFFSCLLILSICPFLPLMIAVNEQVANGTAVKMTLD